MRFYRYLLLPAVCLFCLTCLVACENSAPADQFTLVQGTVTSADTGRPLPGVRIGIQSFSRDILAHFYFTPTGDSVRTDAQGRYTLHFYNKKGLYYVVSFEPDLSVSYGSRTYPPSRYAFITNGSGTSAGIGPDSYELTLGQTNTVDFKPNELRTVVVRIHNRHTGYQRLDFGYQVLHGNNLDTVTYLRNFYPPATGVKLNYYNLTASGNVGKDTAVALVFQNRSAPPPDTLRATLTFVR